MGGFLFQYIDKKRHMVQACAEDVSTFINSTLTKPLSVFENSNQ